MSTNRNIIVAFIPSSCKKESETSVVAQRGKSVAGGAGDGSGSMRVNAPLLKRSGDVNGILRPVRKI
jgi:hypothetical protein